MSYVIYRTDGTIFTTIPDGVVNTTSSPQGLPGRNYPGYGQVFDTNFVHQLENFANVTPPPDPVRGQLWYNTTTTSLNVCPTDGQTNPTMWIQLVPTVGTGNLTIGNVSVISNVAANNANITNQLNANVISANYLTVNVSATISSANIVNSIFTGNTNVANLLTTNITTGNVANNGILTGTWTVAGSGTANGISGTALSVIDGNLLIQGANSIGIRTDNYYYANGSPLSFTGTYSNSNVSSYLPTYTGNVGANGGSTTFNGVVLSAGANTTPGTIIGNWTLTTGSNINGITVSGANVTSPVANSNYANFSGNSVNSTNANVALTANLANYAITVTGNAQPNITSVGTLTSLSVAGSISNATWNGNVIQPANGGIGLTTSPTAGQVPIGTGSGYALNTITAGTGISITNAPGVITVSTTISAFPSGGIIMWSGAIATIPSGWALCNGSNGTPDLRGQFVVGAGGTYAPGASGGSSIMTITVSDTALSVAQVPPHTHVPTLYDPEHYHTYTDNGHDHNLEGVWVYLLGGPNQEPILSYERGPEFTDTVDTSVTGISINSAATGITVSIANTGGGAGHTHAASATTNLPPYLALAYIMKL